MVATVTALRPSSGGQQRRPVLVGDGVAQFLATPRCNESPHTHRAYAGALHRVADLVGTNRLLAAVDNTEIATAVTTLWGNCAPTTFNRNRAAVASWLAWCATKAKWAAPALPATCERRKEPADETKAVEQPMIDWICTRRDIPLRERLLWRMLYETASRATAVLELNIEDCDFDNRRATVTVKAAPPSGSSGAEEPPCCYPATYADGNPGRCSAPSAAPDPHAGPPHPAATDARKPAECDSATTAPAP